MKNFLVVFVLISASLPALSQGRDTVFAVHKLFSQKRGSANGYRATADSAFSLTKHVQLDAGRVRNIQKKPDWVGSAAFMGVSMLKGARYSVEEEAYVLRLYSGGQPIPAGIRKKLRRKHFHVSPRDIVSK